MIKYIYVVLILLIGLNCYGANTPGGMYNWWHLVGSSQDGIGNKATGDLTLNGKMIFDTIKGVATADPTREEGLLFYDSNKKVWSQYTDVSDVTLNSCVEDVIRIQNLTGSDIPNLRVVYPNGIGGNPATVAPANARYFAMSRPLAVTTAYVTNGVESWATQRGEVTGDTSDWAVGTKLYLSDTAEGMLTFNEPIDGSYKCSIGTVTVSDATSGILLVDIYIPSITVEITDTNGFPPDQRIATDIQFDNESKTFYIIPTGSEFHYYCCGVKYEKSAAESIAITDVSGLHVFYYDGDTLTTVANPTTTQVETVIRTKAIISYVYWNATEQECYYIGDERHGISMSPETHNYLHFTRGAQYLYGLAIGDLTVDASGDGINSALWSSTSGAVADEDIMNVVNAKGLMDEVKIWYREGTDDWVEEVSNIPVLATSGGRLIWNEYNGSTWTRTEVTNNDFVLMHVFATNDVSGGLYIMMGQNKYNTLGLARTGANQEISNLATGILPMEEGIPIATIIYQTSDGYSNSVKARVISTEDGEDYIDWKTSELAQGVAPTNHSNLINLDVPTDHPWALDRSGVNGPMLADLDMGSHSITNVGSLSGNGDDVTLDPTNWDNNLSGVTPNLKDVMDAVDELSISVGNGFLPYRYNNIPTPSSTDEVTLAFDSGEVRASKIGLYYKLITGMTYKINATLVSTLAAIIDCTADSDTDFLELSFWDTQSIGNITAEVNVWDYTAVSPRAGQSTTVDKTEWNDNGTIEITFEFFEIDYTDSGSFCGIGELKYDVFSTRNDVIGSIGLRNTNSGAIDDIVAGYNLSGVNNLITLISSPTNNVRYYCKIAIGNYRSGSDLVDLHFWCDTSPIVAQDGVVVSDATATAGNEWYYTVSGYDGTYAGTRIENLLIERF